MKPYTIINLHNLKNVCCYLLVINTIHAILNASIFFVGFLFIFLKAFIQFTQDLVGQVLLSLKFLPTSQRLEIGVLKVRTALNGKCSDAGTNEEFQEKYILDIVNVKHITNYIANFFFFAYVVCFSALFLKVGVRYNQHKLRSQKTSTVACSPMTVFNDVLLFSLPELPLQECKIVVSVYNTYMTNRSSRQLVGQFTAGRDNHFEDEHWHSMMDSMRQPVARWHGLLL